MISYSGKMLITDQRNQLADEVIEAIECLKSWRKAGLIDEAELEGVEIMMKDIDERDQKQKQKSQGNYSSLASESLMTGSE